MPGTSYETSFSLFEYKNATWTAINSGTPVPGPTWTQALDTGSANECLSNHQHCFGAIAVNAANPTPSASRRLDILPPVSQFREPPVVAVYVIDEVNTVLWYAYPDALEYQVWGYHGLISTLAYQGVSDMIRLNRHPGTVNEYSVCARFADGWGPCTDFVHVLGTG